MSRHKENNNNKITHKPIKDKIGTGTVLKSTVTSNDVSLQFLNLLQLKFSFVNELIFV